MIFTLSRSLGALKGIVRNKARPEGSIAGAFVLKESMVFCKRYLRGVETRMHPVDRYRDMEEQSDANVSVFRHRIRPLTCGKLVKVAPLDWENATWYVLNNCDDIAMYSK